jgi:hypothetical protein
MKVITKIAITTVPMRDSRDPIRSDPKPLVPGGGGAGVGSAGEGASVVGGGLAGSLRVATSTDGSAWFDKDAASVSDTEG